MSGPVIRVVETISTLYLIMEGPERSVWRRLAPLAGPAWPLRPGEKPVSFLGIGPCVRVPPEEAKMVFEEHALSS